MEKYSPIVVSYGAGTNSTALLIECWLRGIEVDLILFADTGAERPHTYKYIEMFSDWLVKHDMPEIVTVKYKRETLEEKCHRNKQLPSLAYGFKTCSLTFKVDPQNQYVNNWYKSKYAWKNGHKVIKLVGYDADESHRIKNYDDEKYTVKYPLVKWDYGRDECVSIIKNAGLCLPGKSSCFFCPSMKATEIRQLAHIYPELAKRALDIEAQAQLTHVKGLGRSFAWKDLLSQDEMLDDDYGLSPELACGCYDG